MPDIHAYLDYTKEKYPSYFKESSTKYRYDYVFNLSALKHVRSEKDPYTLMRMTMVNVFNTIKTLRLAKKMGATEETLDFNQKISELVYEVIKKEQPIDSLKVEIKNTLTNYKTELGSSPYSFYINDALIKQLSDISENKWFKTFYLEKDHVVCQRFF